MECPKWLWQTNDWSRGIRDGKWTVYDESSLANEFNDFFTKTLEQLGKDDHPSDSVSDDSKLKKFISSRLSPTTSCVIPEIKPQEVADIISKISVNKTTGHDGLSAKILKLITPWFIHLLCRLLNLWIATNTFPDKWKVGQVTPDCTKVVSNVKEIPIAP